MNALARAAWCIGHDRRLNNENRGGYNPITADGRLAASLVQAKKQGTWHARPHELKFSKLRVGTILPVQRWKWGECS